METLFRDFFLHENTLAIETKLKTTARKILKANNNKEISKHQDVNLRKNKKYVEKYVKFYCKALSVIKLLLFSGNKPVSLVISWNKRMLRKALY